MKLSKIPKHIWFGVGIPILLVAIGLYRTPQLIEMYHQRQDALVKDLYEEGYNLLIKKRDQAGAALKFKECLHKYSDTRYMKSKVPPSNKTRIEIINGLLRAIGR